MPIEIGEVQSTVEVERGTGASEGSPSSPPPVQAQQRWLDIARRQQELQERTAAWRFDD
jgi:hypothetical protein